MMPLGSGVGSWPGESAREAVRTIAELVGGSEYGVAYLPETPGRGPGADMIGRAAGMLVEMPVDLQPSGWRLTDAAGRDVRRARAFLREDLEELAEAYDGWTHDLKVQIAGPWTLAASVALPRGERAVHDLGAARELAESLAEGVRAHLADVMRLVPGARVIVQVDEPSLPAVLAGRLPTVSGFSRLRAVEEPVARAGLETVLKAVPDSVETVVHCCAPEVPVRVLHECGFGGLALDISLLGEREWEQLAEAIEGGVRLWAGVVSSGSPRQTGDADGAVRPLLAAWEGLGLDPQRLANAVLTPACGLAGKTRDEALLAQRTALTAVEALGERVQSG